MFIFHLKLLGLRIHTLMIACTGCHFHQDILRLLTLWFYHGASRDVQDALQKGFDSVPVETWLAVLPQIIARIHSNTPAVRTLIQSLLVRIGRSHPQVFCLPRL